MKKLLVVLFVLAVFGGSFYCSSMNPKRMACQTACTAARDKCVAPEEKKVKERGKTVTKKVEKNAAEKAACEVTYNKCYREC